MFKGLLMFVLALIMISVVLFYKNNYLEVKIEFDKLRPQQNASDIYYNGYKIGHSVKFYPCETSKNMCVLSLIKSNKMFIPKNISAVMKQRRIHDRKYEDYIELLYPENPDYDSLKNGDLIKGVLAGGFHNYLNEEVHFSEMKQIKLSLLNAANNLEKSTEILLNILESVDDAVLDSKKDIKSSAKNLSNLSRNLNSIASKIDNSIDDERIKNFMINLDNAGVNLSDSTSHIKLLTHDALFSSDSIMNTITNFDSISKNIDDIVRGLNCTLKKPFALFRLLFGRISSYFLLIAPFGRLALSI